MLCASAFAGPTICRETTTRLRVARQVPAPRQVKVFIMTSASAIPKPISYIIGGVVTTAVPIEIIGRGDAASR